MPSCSLKVAFGSAHLSNPSGLANCPEELLSRSISLSLRREKKTVSTSSPHLSSNFESNTLLICPKNLEFLLGLEML